MVSSQTTFKTAIPGSQGFSIYVNWQSSIISPEHHKLNRFIESPLAHSTILFRKALIDRFGLYTTLPVPKDYEMWLRWMDQGVRFYKISQPLLTWNDHPHRLIRNHDKYSREAFFKIKCKYLARWIKCHLSPEKKSSCVAAAASAANEPKCFRISVLKFLDLPM